MLPQRSGGSIEQCFKNGLCSWTGKMEQAKVASAIGKNDLLGHQIAIEVLVYLIALTEATVDPIGRGSRRLQAVDPNVGNHPSLARGQEGLARLAGSQAKHIIRGEVVQEAGRIFAGHFDLARTRDVEEGCLCARTSVVGLEGVERLRRKPSAHFGKIGASAGSGLVKWTDL
jgi:hypothetical protein